MNQNTVRKRETEDVDTDELAFLLWLRDLEYEYEHPRLLNAWQGILLAAVIGTAMWLGLIELVRWLI